VAYVHHLFRTKCEPTAATLLTVHNLHFMTDLMKAQRQAILDGEV
jgi:tRNA-guanine family transglycosylase